MIRTSLYTNNAFTQVLTPSAKTADVNGSSVDMQGYNQCTFVAIVGAEGDTLSDSVYIELEVEESADDSTFTDVADADLANYVAGTNDGCFALINIAAEANTNYQTAYRGTARYVRPVVNVTGTHSNGTVIGILAIREKNDKPANAVTTQ